MLPPCRPVSFSIGIAACAPDGRHVAMVSLRVSLRSGNSLCHGFGGRVSGGGFNYPWLLTLDRHAHVLGCWGPPQPGAGRDRCRWSARFPVSLVSGDEIGKRTRCTCPYLSRIETMTDLLGFSGHPCGVRVKNRPSYRWLAYSRILP